LKSAKRGVSEKEEGRVEEKEEIREAVHPEIVRQKNNRIQMGLCPIDNLFYQKFIKRCFSKKEPGRATIPLFHLDCMKDFSLEMLLFQ